MGLKRRSFLKFIAGAGVGTLVTPIPWKLLDDASIWTQNWSWIPRNQPGVTTYVNSISKLCPSNAAVKVRLAGNRPVQVLPNKNHPLGGGVSPIAAAEVQMLYSPSRVTKPLKKSKDGAFVETSWAEAAKSIAEAFKTAGKRSAYISGDENGSMTEVMSAFASAMGSDQVFLMPSEGQSAAQALNRMGIRGRLGYDFENSDCILAIGANILESFGPVMANRKAIMQKDQRARLVYAGPVRNNTANIADTWLPIAPDSETFLAMGISAELIRRGRNIYISEFNGFRRLCDGISLDETAKETGISKESILELVDALEEAKAPIIVAGSTGAGGVGTAPIVASFAANALLGNLNKPGGVQVLPEAKAILPRAEARFDIQQRDLVKWFDTQKSTQVLLIHEANPVYSLPNPKAVKKTLDEIPLKVAFASFMSETAELCDYVLPMPMNLERVDDVLNPYGLPVSVYCASSSAKFQSETSLDTANALMAIAANLGKEIGFKRYFEVIEGRCLAERGNIDLLVRGEPIIKTDKVNLNSFSLVLDLLAKSIGTEKAKGPRLVAEYKLALGTAVSGIPPFNTKAIRESDLDKKGMYVRMNKATAAEYSLKDGDKVSLTSENASINACVRIDEGVAPDTVAGVLGFGHTAFDEFSQNKGANIMDLFTAEAEPATGYSTWSSAIIKITKA